MNNTQVAKTDDAPTVNFTLVPDTTTQPLQKNLSKSSSINKPAHPLWVTRPKHPRARVTPKPYGPWHFDIPKVDYTYDWDECGYGIPYVPPVGTPEHKEWAERREWWRNTFDVFYGNLDVDEEEYFETYGVFPPWVDLSTERYADFEPEEMARAPVTMGWKTKIVTLFGNLPFVVYFAWYVPYYQEVYTFFEKAWWAKWYYPNIVTAVAVLYMLVLAGYMLLQYHPKAAVRYYAWGGQSYFSSNIDASFMGVALLSYFCIGLGVCDYLFGTTFIHTIYLFLHNHVPHTYHPIQFVK